MPRYDEEEILDWIEQHRATVEWSLADCWSVHIKTGDKAGVTWHGGDDLRDLIKQGMQTYTP